MTGSEPGHEDRPGRDSPPDVQGPGMPRWVKGFAIAGVVLLLLIGGGVLASVVLAVVGVSSSDAALIRGSYLSLESIGWYVLVPLSVASLATGLIQSLGTSWGLARHY